VRLAISAIPFVINNFKGISAVDHSIFYYKYGNLTP